ncbi:hypothetical protein N1851_003888 [Merluccius polli]|uniref:Uncharacterized protein n=1 Tax=Merluccius polli TaxID=89951 RepID=A0AA47PA40_MERPO|nr:hypothetical protein N1851_003888 [Merluccius polli]
MRLFYSLLDGKDLSPRSFKWDFRKESSRNARGQLPACCMIALSRSKWRIHKLGAIYFTSRNFYNLILLNINCVALFHAQDIKTYSFSKILDLVVHDIKIIERDGIRVTTLYDQPVPTIVQVTGDNLGFVESFSARYCCRFCLAQKNVFQTEFN